MKIRWIAGALTSALFLWLALAGACNLDLFLIGQTAQCSLSFPALILSLHRPHVALLFLLLAGLGLLLVAWMLFGSSHLKYKSGMYEVVPGLKIPRPEGQGQHGTAWWMPESRYPKAFGAATLDEDAPIFRELILANVPEREKIERRNTPYESESE